MDENGLLSEIFDTRYLGTTRCSLLYAIWKLRNKACQENVIYCVQCNIVVSSGQIKYRISSIRSRPRLEAAVLFDVGEIQAARSYLKLEIWRGQGLRTNAPCIILP